MGISIPLLGSGNLPTIVSAHTGRRLSETMASDTSCLRHRIYVFTIVRDEAFVKDFFEKDKMGEVIEGG